MNRGAEHLAWRSMIDAWRSMIDEVMFEIRELSGQEYVNRYHGDEADSELVVMAQVGHVADAVSAARELGAAADG